MTTLSIAPAFDVSRPAARVRRPAPARLRLTRRGRLLVTFAMVVLALVVFTAFSGLSIATAERGEAPATRAVVVHEGDTLWAIASTIAEPGQIREVVYEIKELNSLPSVSLVEGQVLAVPAR